MLLLENSFQVEMKEMNKKLGALMVTGALALPTSVSAGSFGKVDAVVNTTGALVDASAGVQSPGHLYVQGFCRTRAMKTWDEGGDNLFTLCAGNIGYKGLTIGLQERFSAGADYQMVPFASVGASGSVEPNEELKLSGTTSLSSSIPYGVLELRIAGSMDIESDQWFVPSSVEFESMTWLTGSKFTGTERLFVGYDFGKVEVGPYVELDWTEDGASVAPGIKLRYDGN